MILCCHSSLINCCRGNLDLCLIGCCLAAMSRRNRWLLPAQPPPEHSSATGTGVGPTGSAGEVSQPLHATGVLQLAHSPAAVTLGPPNRSAGCYCLAAPRLCMLTKYLSFCRPPELEVAKKNAYALLHGLAFATMFSCSSSEVHTLQDCVSKLCVTHIVFTSAALFRY